MFKHVNGKQVPLSDADLKFREMVSKADEDIKLDLAMEEIRRNRDRLLSETDHYALQDVDLSGEMATYRQALRDLPSTVDINNPVYPDKP
jgi:hypothetical protein